MAGDRALRGYQTSTGSESGDVPGWEIRGRNTYFPILISDKTGFCAVSLVSAVPSDVLDVLNDYHSRHELKYRLASKSRPEAMLQHQ